VSEALHVFECERVCVRVRVCVAVQTEIDRVSANSQCECACVKRKSGCEMIKLRRIHIGRHEPFSGSSGKNRNMVVHHSFSNCGVCVATARDCLCVAGQSRCRKTPPYWATPPACGVFWRKNASPRDAAVAARVHVHHHYRSSKSVRGGDSGVVLGRCHCVNKGADRNVDTCDRKTNKYSPGWLHQRRDEPPVRNHRADLIEERHGRSTSSDETLVFLVVCVCSCS
jgi:hypothetical protein